MATLPNDILLMIGEEFYKQRDFGSLLCFSLTCRSMAAICLPLMYRIQDAAPARRDELYVYTAEGSKKFNKWVRLWQSICMSAVAPESTVMPYVNYLRSLDLNNLKSLFEDFQGERRKKFKDAFFRKELKRYEETITGAHGKKILHANKVVIDLASEIAKHGAFVEELSGEIPPDALQQWLATMPKLSSIRIWSGKATVEETAVVLKQHCPAFSKLCILNFHDFGEPADADAAFANFILGLKEQSLSSLEIFDFRKLNRKTLEALSKSQNRSLRVLFLESVDNDTLVEIGKLDEFPALRSITLGGEGIRDDVITPSVRSSLSSWLGAARDLEELSLGYIRPAANLMREYFSDFGAECKIRKLTVTGYNMSDKGKEFHEAISVLSSKLEYLSLSGQLHDLDEDGWRENLNPLMASLSSLTKLKSLSLFGVAWLLTDEMIISALCNLTALETLDMEGSGLTNRVLECAANLPNMRNMSLQGDNEFTSAGISSFLNRVDIGPLGYNVDLSGTKNLDDRDVATLKSMFATRGGAFDLTAWEEDSDDDNWMDD